MESSLQSEAKMHADYCTVFSNPRRVLILWALANQELSVGEIAKYIHASIQNTSQHLRLMKDRGILTARRSGPTVYYSLSSSQMLQTCGLLECKPNIEKYKE
jgi:DNA-binding transcriptional ArsR family regulator